jgi:L-ribulose-5-phosphate 4-epimerase
MSRYTELREECWSANRRLPELGLADLTFGNVSVIDRARGVFAIKPSGVEYAKLTPDDLVLLDLEGKVVEGKLRPSSDTPTHRRLSPRPAVRSRVSARPMPTTFMATCR